MILIFFFFFLYSGFSVSPENKMLHIKIHFPVGNSCSFLQTKCLKPTCKVIVLNKCSK